MQSVTNFFRRLLESLLKLLPPESQPRMSLVQARSGKWARVRAEHLKIQPLCQACGSSTNLEVHHIKPFHEDPSLELDPKNLITLCEGKHFCHLLFGHLLSWKSYNLNVVEDAKHWSDKIKNRP